MPTSPNIQYLDDSYKQRTAYLTEASWGHGLGATDPQWFVIHQEDNSLHGPFDFLTYVGEDRNYYHIQVHAEWRGNNTLHIWCSHEYRDGGGGFQDSNDFTIRDWTNTPVHVHVQDMVQNNNTPKFITP